MYQEQILNKLEELREGQLAIRHCLELMLDRDGNNEWLDSHDLKRMFHISKSTLYRLKKEKILHPRVLGRKEFFRKTDVEAAIVPRAGAGAPMSPEPRL